VCAREPVKALGPVVDSVVVAGSELAVSRTSEETEELRTISCISSAWAVTMFQLFLSSPGDSVPELLTPYALHPRPLSRHC